MNSQKYVAGQEESNDKNDEMNHGMRKNKRMIKKRYFIMAFVGIALMAFSIASLVSNTGTRAENVYNDDAWIAAQGDTYTYSFQAKSSSGQQMAMKFNMSGMETLWDVEVSTKSKVTFEYDLTVSSGDFKIVLIGPEKEVQTLVEGTDSGKVTKALEAGTYRLKVVGRKAKGALQFEVLESENIHVKLY